MLKKSDPWYVISSRALLGFVFLISGLHGFVGFSGIDFVSPDARAIIEPILNSPSYYALKITELVIAVALISNFFVQTALVMAVPVVLNIILYNWWLQFPEGILTMLLLVPLAALFYFYRNTYKVFFKPQIFTNHMGEDSSKVLVYDEVIEKAPDKVKEFEAIFRTVRQVDTRS